MELTEKQRQMGVEAIDNLVTVYETIDSGKIPKGLSTAVGWLEGWALIALNRPLRHLRVKCS